MARLQPARDDCTRHMTNFVGALLSPEMPTCWLTTDYRTAGLYRNNSLEPLLLLPPGVLPLALAPNGQSLVVSLQAQRLQVWNLAKVREEFQSLGLLPLD